MGLHAHHETLPNINFTFFPETTTATSTTTTTCSSTPSDLSWPFGKLEDIDSDDLRVTAYEIFFTSCRSSPGFGGRTTLNYYPSDSGGGETGSGLGPGPGSGTSGKGPALGITVNSR